MADVNDIVAHGFGGWSTVNSIPTLGFGIGVDVDYYDVEAVTGSITLSGVPVDIKRVNLTLNSAGGDQYDVEEQTVAVRVNGQPPMDVTKISLVSV